MNFYTLKKKFKSKYIKMEVSMKGKCIMIKEKEAEHNMKSMGICIKENYTPGNTIWKKARAYRNISDTSIERRTRQLWARV